ncbi:TetR/AcrR family transcriptional regulator [Salininema proteolyticum]|uniref:TetR/AcrR family transcriptional regulator n=1 Tax=Salininema proteolyticum TaxID=1607685 RepID=A0ABV8TTV0_9ACTN
MAERQTGPGGGRRTVSREKVLEAAVALADEAGSGVPSMRKLAARLGIEAMSLYHHFRSKDLILDGMVDSVFGEVELPRPGVDWRTGMRARAGSMRDALNRHPWAVGLMDSRKNPGRATLRHHEAVIGGLREGGFSIAGAARAALIMDGYVYGFVLQEAALPSGPGELEDVGESILDGLSAEEYPHLREMVADRAFASGPDFAAEFAVGFDLVLEGLERHRDDW